MHYNTHILKIDIHSDCYIKINVQIMKVVFYALFINKNEYFEMTAVSIVK